MGGAIAAIALLAVLGMSVSGLVAESTQGSGEAINRAGSLRMQSWRMASLYLAVPLPQPGQPLDAWRSNPKFRRHAEQRSDPGSCCRAAGDSLHH
jgi:nitrate/nitrite-specific signal transduction histidine kinase